jgi:hypothetical protein
MSWLKRSLDTGWIDVSGYLANGWTADAVQIRRDHNLSYLRFIRLDGRNATGTYFLQNLPTGYFQGNENIPASIAGTWVQVWVQAGGRNLSTSIYPAISATQVTASQYVGGLARP